MTETPIAGIHGCGVTGQAAGRVLRSIGIRQAWFDQAVGAAERARRRFGGVVLDDVAELAVVDVIVVSPAVAVTSGVVVLVSTTRCRPCTTGIV